MLFVLKDGKKSEFYTKFLVNVTDTVDYNECLKLLKSESLGDRFIVNSRCNFTLDSWKLVSLENDEDSEIKQVCSIKDRVDKSIISQVQSFLEKQTTYKNISLNYCDREFTKDFDEVFYSGIFRQGTSSYRFRISSYLSPVY